MERMHMKVRKCRYYCAIGRRTIIDLLCASKSLLSIHCLCGKNGFTVPRSKIRADLSTSVNFLLTHPYTCVCIQTPEFACNGISAACLCFYGFPLCRTTMCISHCVHVCVKCTFKRSIWILFNLAEFAHSVLYSSRMNNITKNDMRKKSLRHEAYYYNIMDVGRYLHMHRLD